MTKISDIFHVQYGNSLELNRLKITTKGVNFISRTAANNGVSAVVERLEDIEPTPAGTITVSLGGSVLEAFLQPLPFYSGYHIYCLVPKAEMTDSQKLYYCLCIRANKYRYNYGRQANRTLRNIEIPNLQEIPHWVNDIDLAKFNTASQSYSGNETPDLLLKEWHWFEIQDIFDIKKGKRLTKLNMKEGETPYIGAIDSNNGYRQYINHEPIHEGNTITVNYNGSVGEAFYQPKPFWATDDVNVLYPRFKMNQYMALFLCGIIRKEKYRFNYGRKWHMERMNISKIKLPVNNDGQPDFKFMEEYIQSLPFSGQI